MVSSIHPSMLQKVYRQDIWWSDKWDPKSYGRDYDPLRSFFGQWKELFDVVPMPALFTEYTTMINSEYCNAAATLKNCYLCFKADKSEDCAYLNTIEKMKDCFDMAYSNFDELCYEGVTINKGFQNFFSINCDECHAVWFSEDLVGCSNCVGCVGLRKKNYCIFNVQYSKEEYEAKLNEFDFGSFDFVKQFRARAYREMLKFPRRQFHGRNNLNSSGDYLYNTKNVRDSYIVQNAENIRYGQLLKAGPAANCMDYTAFATKADWIYECAWVGINTQNVKFSFWCYKNHDIEYCFGCHGAGNLFGCVGIRQGEYCILNKQYNKEEYFALVAKIKAKMIEDGEYGEFFPTSYCPWPINETNLMEWFPLTKEEAQAHGYQWIDPNQREWSAATRELSDHVKDVDESILKEIMKCETCGRNFQFIAKELAFHKRFKIALPRSCPLCRDFSRFSLLNPMSIFNRTCAKCGTAIQTSYASDRPETVYCVQCYQQEVT